MKFCECARKAVRRVIAVFYRRVDNLYIGRRQFFCGERKPPVSDVFANGEPAQNAEDFLKIEWRNVRLCGNIRYVRFLRQMFFNILV